MLLVEGNNHEWVEELVAYLIAAGEFAAILPRGERAGMAKEDVYPHQSLVMSWLHRRATNPHAPLMLSSVPLGLPLVSVRSVRSVVQPCPMVPLPRR